MSCIESVSTEPDETCIVIGSDTSSKSPLTRSQRRGRNSTRTDHRCDSFLHTTTFVLDAGRLCQHVVSNGTSRLRPGIDIGIGTQATFMSDREEMCHDGRGQFARRQG